SGVGRAPRHSPAARTPGPPRSRPGASGRGTAAGSWPESGRRRSAPARSRAGPTEPMRVDDLTALGRAHPGVTLRAAVGQARRRDREVGLAPGVTADAELGSSHGCQAETMLIVVAGRAQTTAELTGGGVADEAAAAGGGR